MRSDTGTAAAAPRTHRSTAAVTNGSVRSAELVDPPLMATAFEGRIQEDPERVPCGLDAGHAGPEGHDIGIIVLAAKPGGERVVDQRGPDMGMTVGSDRNADAGSADQHAPCRTPLGQGGRQCIGEIGIVHRSGSIGPEVQDLQTSGGEIFLQDRFEVDAAVITGDRHDTGAVLGHSDPFHRIETQATGPMTGVPVPDIRRRSPVPEARSRRPSPLTQPACRANCGTHMARRRRMHGHGPLSSAVPDASPIFQIHRRRLWTNTDKVTTSRHISVVVSVGASHHAASDICRAPVHPNRTKFRTWFYPERRRFDMIWKTCGLSCGNTLCGDYNGCQPSESERSMSDSSENPTIAHDKLLSMAAQIVAAYVSHNSLPAQQLPEIIQTVYGALNDQQNGTATAQEVVREEAQKPAVPVRKSITPDYIVCLEDGKKLKMLKRHLRANYGMTPEEYRAKWGLAPDYPMVAPNYARQRSDFAKKIGLGRATNAPRARGGRRAAQA